MAKNFQTLLIGIIANPDRQLEELPFLSQAERHQLLVEWHDREREYPTDRCIHQLFEEQVGRTPDAVALVFEGQQLTYQQLNQRANQLAHHLQSLGVKPEVLVGICVERSIEMVVGLLGILKAGGAYVPLDPAYPKERLAFMLQDAQVPVLLTQESLIAGLPDHQAQIVCLDADWTVIAQESQENLVDRNQAENLAYLIYTSGSTGTPKGVMIPHRSLVNYTKAICLEYELAPTDRILQFASISFDVAAEEIFPCLVQGATLVLRTEEMLGSVLKFLQHSGNLGITVLNLPTAFWHQVAAELDAGKLALPETVRLAIVGGEQALSQHLATWQQQVGQRLRLINCYGPTETTIGATTCDLSGPKAVETVGRELPIGKAIQNVQTYVLNANLHPVPIGVPGQLYLGGVGVARGYLNRADLTAEKFIPNPYSSETGARLYQTGDLVRYRSDGNLEYLGRIDNQVKIRGFRIELGEIEAALNTYPQIQQAVVIATEDTAGNKRLVAYIVTPEGLLAHNQLREFLWSKLPEYMVPSAFVTLDTLPLTPSGKVDRKALPAPDGEIGREQEYVTPRTPSEEIIADIFAAVLGVPNVGIHDNFFDLGGHSLLATQIVSRLRDAFQMELPLRSLFEKPTVALLSDRIQTMRLAIAQVSQPPIAIGNGRKEIKI
jgi:amino acid adenylation domain-containing protein